ncbi:hypothetical protein AX15_001156 [Amanita polypyramis BW_CC]|nr:hypothetical protein AX15_001156 [Amanita polypyramis BW_CC]
MFSLSSGNHLSQQTLVIIIVCASILGTILLLSLCRLVFSSLSSSSAPLPPIQPLAHHREQRARIQADLRETTFYSASYLPAPLVHPSPSSSQGSKASLLGSEIAEEQAVATACEYSPKPNPPSTCSSTTHLAQPSQNVLNGSPARVRSLSSFDTSASRRTRRNAGMPHGPHSHIQVVLPVPLASSLHQTVVHDFERGRPDQLQSIRNSSFVDQWVTGIADHEPAFAGTREDLAGLPRRVPT